MERALEEARRAAASGEVPVGALAVRGGELLSAAHNRTVSTTDPSAHAEILVLREAAARVGNHRLGGVTVYATLEPCLMCVGAMVQARVDRLVFAAADPKVGATGLLAAGDLRSGLNHRIEVSGGLLAEESSALLRAFFAARR